MTTPQRTSQPGTFFVTTACYQRRRLFQVDRNAQLFLENAPALSRALPNVRNLSYVI